jgi:hypothetical protein
LGEASVFHDMILSPHTGDDPVKIVYHILCSLGGSLHDTSITDFGIYESMKDKESLFHTQRDGFQKLSEERVNVEDETHRIEKERTTLQVIRSILEKKKRRWEFIWKGFRIPAIIECDEFYRELERGMKFGIGDKIEVTLEIHQVLDKNTNVWENELSRTMVNPHPRGNQDHGYSPPPGPR